MSDDLIQALAALLSAPTTDDGYMTTSELVEIMHMNPDTVRAKLKLLIQRGEVECKPVPRLAICGRWQPTPGYRFKAQ